MKRINARSYTSPTLVLLAFDWDDGKERNDFLGFAISRTPGFDSKTSSWLPNRISFDGPAKEGKDLPCNTNPIQKFMWWDARFGSTDQEKTFTYDITPVVGTKDNPTLLDAASVSLKVIIPANVRDSIGTYFNRAVVSSQAFSKKFSKVTQDNLDEALAWLANGMQKVIPEFVSESNSLVGAIYHLTDKKWIIPSLEQYDGSLSLVYFWKDQAKNKDIANKNAVDDLKKKDDVTLSPRTRSNIMHNKFLVRISDGDKPTDVLMGSANFTTEGISVQANLLHTFNSPQLAMLYADRERLLAEDLTIKQTANDTGWSDTIQVGNVKVRAFFSPEPKDSRVSIDTIVKSVSGATDSVVFCLFSSTDEPLRDAIFKKGDQGKMMFGLVNSITKPKEPSSSGKPNAEGQAKIEIYHRSQENKDVYSHSLYPQKGQPEGFWWETSSLPGPKAQWPVYIHHKFIVVDGETDHPTIYTGSANMSGNSLHNNDENLLEIKECPDLAQTYLAEFFRLYEHYRARSSWANYKRGKRTYELAKDNSWSTKAYTVGTPEYKSRVDMAARI